MELLKGATSPEGDDMARIDLTTNEVPELLKQPEVKEDKRIKLSKFQCVICMDDATSLVVTNCGHLFCTQCLHSALTLASMKGRCPMCRARVDPRPRATYTVKTRGYWPLELKLMTAKRREKRKAGEIS